MNLDDLLNEMSEKMRNRDLSDKYLREHNNSTREEIGIGEYAYGITMIPCEWVYEYLSDYKRVLKENEELKAKYDKDTHTLQNQLDIANADRIEKDKIIDLMENYMVENSWEICFDNIYAELNNCNIINAPLVEIKVIDNIYAELNNCNGMERDWCRGDELEKKDIHKYFSKKLLESEE